MHHVVALALVMIALSDGAAVEVRKDSERAGEFLDQLSPIFLDLAVREACGQAVRTCNGIT